MCSTGAGGRKVGVTPPFSVADGDGVGVGVALADGVADGLADGVADGVADGAGAGAGALVVGDDGLDVEPMSDEAEDEPESGIGPIGGPLFVITH